MWLALATLITVASSSKPAPNRTSFSENQVIFSSSFNITKLLVPADGSKYVQAESSDLPSIFFTVSDSHYQGGSCVYVLEGLAAYEILEGGRDSTADYSNDRTVYLGAVDGVYKYDPDSLSAKKFGPFQDNIIQIQKANNTDAIYFLTSSHKMYKLEKNGTVKTKFNVVCATQFVLDTSNNVYYVQCGDQTIHILRSDGSLPNITAAVVEDFQSIKLIRPAFIMDDCIPFFGDGTLHILYVNGTCEKKEFYVPDNSGAYSVDAALYLVAALNGKIYEYNVMEVLLRSMFGLGSVGPDNVSKIIMSVVNTTKDNIFGFYKGWYHNN